MSWPSIWQNQNQAPTNQADISTGNMFMTPEQYALQQQSWQQWQIYQAQMTQWQAQYGDQVSVKALNDKENRKFQIIFLFHHFR